MLEKLHKRGDPAPWFTARSPSNERFKFDTVAGRYVVLSFFGSAGDEAGRQMIEFARRRADVFNDDLAAFFGVSIDPTDEGRLREALPGFHLFWDFDQNISRLYKAAGPKAADGSAGVPYRRFSLILDERLRIWSAVPVEGDPASHGERVLESLEQLPALEPAQEVPPPAPVLIVPRVFEPELCRTLIRYYEERGGVDSGFMQEINGRTVAVHDYGYKRRRDQEILDENLRRECMVRIHNRVAPEIKKAFRFHATRIERYMVACYDAETGGHFQPHRDNTTKGTAHRQFAVSLNLNTGEYNGGGLRLPEFGRQTYAAPAGGAIVFACSLLHEATPVTRGKRYAFLPFLYDEASVRVRQENQKFLGAPPAQAAQAAPQAAQAAQ
jgi:peroxiredoxin/predicted 2-oxoglutarate/Fe(II)-dependent dioxygenase YbiX